MNTIFFHLILLLSLTNHIYGFFRSQTKVQTRAKITKDCCIPPKINVNSKKANAGRDFLRQLTANADLYEEVNPENMCNLMHFLFQQASINRKLVSFTEGMFIIFDSSNRFFDRLIKINKKSQQKSKQFHPFSPIKHIGRRSVITALINNSIQQQGISDDRYPTYGMDIPNSCLPSNYDHVIFGELPIFTRHYKYTGRRLFIKPEYFGFEKLKISSVLNQLNSFVKQLIKQQYCRLIKGETKSECIKLRAFKENMDKILFKKWKKILLKIPSKWNINKNYKQRALKYGIHEIDRQSKDLEAAGAGKYVKEFRKLLIQKYGSDDILVRKGREIIFTIDELTRSYSTCETTLDTRCSL